MAFDITPYIDKKPSEVRKLIREGVIDFPTAGMCRGYAQANLIILPPEYAGDFEEFAKRNPFPARSLRSSGVRPRRTIWARAAISAPTFPSIASTAMASGMARS